MRRVATCGNVRSSGGTGHRGCLGAETNLIVTLPVLHKVSLHTLARILEWVPETAGLGGRVNRIPTRQYQAVPMGESRAFRCQARAPRSKSTFLC